MTLCIKQKPQRGEIKKGCEIGKLPVLSLFIWHACEDCGKETWIHLIRGEPAYRKCRSCSHWKGGVIHCNGYIKLFHPEHPKVDSKGYVKQAVLVLEEKLGRPLLFGMVSHHENEIRDDDRPENLEELTRSEHMRLHCKERKSNAN